MKESAYNLFLFWSLSKQILSLGTLSDFIVKIIKLLYVVPKANINCFNTFHLHYKDILVINSTRTFVCAVSCFYFGCWLSNLGNFLMVSFFAHYSRVYIVLPGLVTKKGEPPKTLLHISHLDQPLSLLLNSTFKNAPNNICMFGNLKYAIMCK